MCLKNRDKYDYDKKILKSSEIYSMFLYKYLNILSNMGKLPFILPKSMLNVSTHRKIRNYICNNYTISKIKLIGRIFPEVFTPIIVITVEKKNC